MSFDFLLPSCSDSLAGAAAGLHLGSARATIAVEIVGLSISSHDYRIVAPGITDVMDSLARTICHVIDLE